MTKFIFSNRITLVLLLIVGFGLTNALPCSAADEKPVDKSTTENKPDEKKEEAKVIKLEEAKDNVGKLCTVEFKVASANLKNDQSNCFINSKSSFKDKDNFQVVIFAKDLKKFKEAKIEDPAIHYFKKTIKVTGKIELHKERPEIEVRSPEQIVVVEDDKKDSEKK
jgi:hypothetical protein